MMDKDKTNPDNPKINDLYMNTEDGRGRSGTSATRVSPRLAGRNRT